MYVYIKCIRGAISKVFPVYPDLAIFSVPKADSVQLQFKIIFVLLSSKQSSAYLFQSDSIVHLKDVRHGNDVLLYCQPWSCAQAYCGVSSYLCVKAGST